jgi:hypothetical protein
VLRLARTVVDTQTVALVLAIALPLGVGVYVLWRISRLTGGVRLRRSLLVMLTLFYAALFVVGEASEWARFPVLAPLLDVSLVVLGAIPAAIYLHGTTVFERTMEGRWMYRASIAILLAWYALYLTRLAIEIALTGRVFLFGVPAAPHLSPAYVLFLLTIDSLFAFSTGLLIGANFGVYTRYLEARHSPASDGPPSGAM